MKKGKLEKLNSSNLHKKYSLNILLKLLLNPKKQVESKPFPSKDSEFKNDMQLFPYKD